MAVQTKTNRKRSPARPSKKKPVKRWSVRFLPGWIMLAFVLVVLLPHALSATLGAAGRAISRLPLSVGVAPNDGRIAPMFTSSVEYWSANIAEWAARYNLDPNLLATIIQIESCGDATVSSSAGAQGLFQVMPFHFAAGEDALDPDTNAMRGADFLNECLGLADGDTGLAMACYNGGPGMISTPFAAWPDQTQRYYVWGTTIYQDARADKASSDSLAQWLNAGGINLCSRAAASLGLNG